ncbi:MAG: tetratricopeptide repeat protein, partial [Candidatus Hodarchaeota archaeon]
MSTQGIDLRNIFLEAKKDFSKGNFDAALRKWQKIFLKLRNMDNTEGMAEILYNIAMVQKKLGQFQESIINLKETLEMYQFLRNDERVALVLYTLGLIHSEIGKLEIAWRYLEEASILFQADNNVEYLSKIIFEIGNINLMKNDLEPSRENFLKCIEFQEQLGDEISKGKCYYSLSLLEIIGKNTSKANEYLEKAATIFNEANFFEGKIKIKSVEGLLALRGNDIQKAEKIFKECTKLIADKYIRLPASSGMIEKQEEVQILLYMGDLFIKDSKLNLPDIGKTLNLKAYDYFKDAKEISEKIGYKKGIGQTSFQMAMILFNRGIQEDLKKSAELFRYSLEMAKSIKDNELITRCLLYLGINYRRIYQYDEGLTFLQDCFIFSRKLNYHELEARSLIEKHRILYQVGKLDEALSTLHAAREIAENHADLRNLLANIYFLLGVFHFEVGEIKESSDFLSRSRSIFVELDNKSGIIKILFEFARLNEEQGYLTHSIQYLDEIENIFQERSQIKDISRIRIKKGKLYFLKGNSEKSLEILGKEISYLEGIRVSGRDALVTEAKLVIYNILKNSGKVFEANEIFNDIFSFFNKNEKLLELFDIFLNLTYESLEDGKYEIINPAINK